MDYEIVVGLEVHAELNTQTKIYCSCKNSFGSEVNSNCCPVCRCCEEVHWVVS